MWKVLLDLFFANLQKFIQIILGGLNFVDSIFADYSLSKNLIQANISCYRYIVLQEQNCWRHVTRPFLFLWKVWLGQTNGLVGLVSIGFVCHCITDSLCHINTGSDRNHCWTLVVISLHSVLLISRFLVHISKHIVSSHGRKKAGWIYADEIMCKTVATTEPFILSNAQYNCDN